MARSLVLLVGVLASLWTLSSQAQEAILGQLYGSGVHAYFSGDYLKAYDKLTAAIQAGSRDPRAFYFRGLVYLQLGRGPEARMDFQKGSELETGDVNKFYNVARALERVQGPARLQLETYRADARMAALERAEKLRKARYEAIQREEARVLQQQAEEAAMPAETTPEVVPAPSGEATGTEPAPETGVDPFSTSKGEKQPAGIVAEPGAETTDKTTPEKKADTTVEDPFAVKSAAEEKPAAEKKSAIEDPFAAKPAGEEKPAAKKSILGALGKSLTKGVTGRDIQSGKDNAAEKPTETKPADVGGPFAK